MAVSCALWWRQNETIMILIVDILLRNTGVRACFMLVFHCVPILPNLK